jgi:hypothetical protein
MPLEPLLPLFHRLDRQYFDASLAALINPPLLLRWSDGRLSRTAGFYRFGPGISEIVLSRVVLVPLPPEATLSTLCHEMIHAWVDRVLGLKEVHGPQFKARMAHINQAQPGIATPCRCRLPPGGPVVLTAAKKLPTAAAVRAWPAAVVANATTLGCGMPVLPLSSARPPLSKLAEFLGGILVSGWVISAIGLWRESQLRRSSIKVQARP